MTHIEYSENRFETNLPYVETTIGYYIYNKGNMG